VRRLHQHPRAVWVGLELLASQPEVERKRNEAGLRTVVEVALDPLELGGLRVDRARSSLGELEHALLERSPATRAEQHRGQPRLDEREQTHDPGRCQADPDAREACEHGEPPGVDVEDPWVVALAVVDPPPERQRQLRHPEQPECSRGDSAEKGNGASDSEPRNVLPGLEVLDGRRETRPDAIVGRLVVA
jgi:hypothetical protein